ncbi:MAG: hypothetical protein MJZ74_08165 [Muribaculaceae bacterium]|nr:hypothetical protein [Muribaculaceae bacterium]
MSKILSYSNKTSKNVGGDWIPVEPYSEDDIAQIKDPDGGLSSNPRTAIPSPFAQIDLVKTAFHNLANPQLQGAVMNEHLVSNALDVAQLLFDFENHKDYLRIVTWNRKDELARLKANGQHRLFGETLELFLAADKVYNFDDLENWYILVWEGRVLGGTSPSSVVMAAPACEPISQIKVEQGVSLFSGVRHLWERDEDFVYYMFLLFNAYLTLREKAGQVYSYMMHNAAMLRTRRPELYNRIIEVIPNPNAMSHDNQGVVMERLNRDFDRFSGNAQVSVLGAYLYHKRARDIREQASHSDFVISPTVPQPDGAVLPLVLRSGFNGSVEHYRYIDKDWDSATVVFTGGLPVEQRKLPATSIEYPYLTTVDLLNDTLVKLNGALDDDHFLDGNLQARDIVARNGYLLPVKPLYFKYFTSTDLCGRTHGLNVLDIIENSDGSVTVTLRIPVKKRYIELTRVYMPITDVAWQFDEMRGTGRVATATLSASVFPFVRTGHHDDYTVQLFSMIPDAKASLRFMHNSGATGNLIVSKKTRSCSGPFTTTYYDVDGSWDYMEVEVKSDMGTLTGLIVPLWKPYTPSATDLVFAVDFGTTNSHVEWAVKGQASQPLTMGYSEGQALIVSLMKPGGLDIAEQVQRVEFLPRDIDNVYGFPMRSSLARNVDSDGGNKLFHDVNIPFLYERKFFDGYNVTTNLKWMGDNQLAKEFLREIVLLIKAKALLENVDLRRVEVVYFYPVSMSGAGRRQLRETWEDLFRTYISDDMGKLHNCPESLAPAAYYKGPDVDGASYVSIDIGGGTSDAVIYQPTADGMGSEPVAISSFRFAGNAIFGDAFVDKDAEHNPLLAHYSRYFRQLIENDRSTGIAYLTSILDKIASQQRSEDINAFLFSIENVEELRDLREIDRNLYSYNTLLRNDGQRKIIFMYFYAAIIYYIAMMMKKRGYKMPKQIYFSGTGSKILNIVGNSSMVTELSKFIIEKAYGQRYTERFSIKIETECPKQITCRGGVKMVANDETVAYTPREVNALKFNYSMLPQEELTLAVAKEADTRECIVESVKEFNRFFIELCDTDMRDDFGIDKNVFKTFCDVVNDDLGNYLTAGINAFLGGRYEEGDVIEDVPFFYPIVGVIRHNLLKNLQYNSAR